MKFTAFAVIAAGAAFVSASPLRVIAISSNSVQRTETFPGGVMRFGHAVPQAMPMPVPELTMTKYVSGQQRRPCMGGRFRQKAVDVSNSFRKMFGFPLIESGEVPHNKEIHGGMIRILPFAPGSGGPTFAHVDEQMRGGKGWLGRTKGGDRVEFVPSRFGEGRVTHAIQLDQGRPRSHHNYHSQDFFARIQHAIMSLGPWEGRAVAFVLGCGIGVLLRMFFVISVVLFRSLRGSDEEPEYQEVLVFEVEENDSRLAAPPAYIYPVDEKVAAKAPVQAEA